VVQVYSGAASEMPAFLETHGVECPPHHNPADVVIDAVASRSTQQIDEFMAVDGGPAKSGNSTDLGTKEDFAPLAEGRDSSIFASLFYGYNTSFITQFSVLFHRTTLHTLRSPALFHVHYIVIILLGVLLGYVRNLKIHHLILNNFWLRANSFRDNSEFNLSLRTIFTLQLKFKKKVYFFE
jgi:hypothetical protein